MTQSKVPDKALMPYMWFLMRLYPGESRCRAEWNCDYLLRFAWLVCLADGGKGPCRSAMQSFRSWYKSAANKAQAFARCAEWSKSELHA